MVHHPSYLLPPALPQHHPSLGGFLPTQLQSGWPEILFVVLVLEVFWFIPPALPAGKVAGECR